MTLVDVLKKQNQAINLSDLTQSNIESLESTDTFTITTGHQLCIFTGPLYFLYKIVSTINLSLALKEKYPSKHFVPVFWLASEDHDFDEINHINLFDQTIRWDSSQGGAVGRMNLSNFSNVLEDLNLLIGKGQNAERLKAIFYKAYSSTNLALATRILINELFKDDIVIIDGDDVHLKVFVDIMKKDIQDHILHQNLQDLNLQLINSKPSKLKMLLLLLKAFFSNIIIYNRLIFCKYLNNYLLHNTFS